MSRNPRRLHNPHRVAVSFERRHIEAMDAVMKAGRHHKHRNRMEFIRRSVEQELARCTGD